MLNPKNDAQDNTILKYKIFLLITDESFLVRNEELCEKLWQEMRSM